MKENNTKGKKYTWEELETEIVNEDSIYSEASCGFRIDELKNLLK